jgi:hypothetical protein
MSFLRPAQIRRPFRAAMLVAALAISSASIAAAQAPLAHAKNVTLAVGGVAHRISDLNGWAFGPAAQVQVKLGSKFLFESTLEGLLSSTGFYDFSGLGIDIGPAYAFRSDKTTGSIGLGFTAIVGGDSDGSGGGFAGGYASAQVTQWISPGVGVLVKGTARYTSGERFSPGAMVGLNVGL